MSVLLVFSLSFWFPVLSLSLLASHASAASSFPCSLSSFPHFPLRLSLCSSSDLPLPSAFSATFIYLQLYLSMISLPLCNLSVFLPSVVPSFFLLITQLTSPTWFLKCNLSFLSYRSCFIASPSRVLFCSVLFAPDCTLPTYFTLNTTSHMWICLSLPLCFRSSLQSLHKACEVARCHNYYPGSLFLTWISYYQSQISSNQLCINEWNAMQDVESHRANSPVPFTDLWVFFTDDDKYRISLGLFHPPYIDIRFHSVAQPPLMCGVKFLWSEYTPLSIFKASTRKSFFGSQKLLYTKSHMIKIRTGM